MEKTSKPISEIKTLNDLVDQFGINALLMLSWCIASIYTNISKDSVCNLPVLFVYGKTEAERLEICKLLLNLFKTSPSYDIDKMIFDGNKMTISKFFRTADTIEKVPILISGYRDNILHRRILTHSFDKSGYTIATAKQDNSTLIFKIKSGVIITGSKTPSEMHEYNRCFFINLDDMIPCQTNNKFNINLSKLIPKVLLKVDDQEFKSLLNRSSDRLNVLAVIEETFGGRSVDNCSNIYAGYQILTSIVPVPNVISEYHWIHSMIEYKK